MEIGEPDFPTPEPVLAAARQALVGGAIYYTSALGIPALREAIARHYHDHYGAKVAPERIVVTAGSSAAFRFKPEPASAETCATPDRRPIPRPA